VFDWPFVGMIAFGIFGFCFWVLNYMFLYVSFCVYLVLNFWVVICFSSIFHAGLGIEFEYWLV
jgi:hypothetical protein